MATHSSILAWRISWTEEPGGLRSMGSQKVGHDRVTHILSLLPHIAHQDNFFSQSVNTVWEPTVCPGQSETLWHVQKKYLLLERNPQSNQKRKTYIKQWEAVIGKFPWCLLSISFYNTVLPILASSHFSESKCLSFIKESLLLQPLYTFFAATHF